MPDYSNLYKHLQNRPAVHSSPPRTVSNPQMAGPQQQYNFPPPPPPPGPAPNQQPQQYGYGPPPQFQQGRGGGPHRGVRGGGPGGHPYPHQQSYPPPQQHGPPQGFNGPPHHNQPAPAPYIGPQAHPPHQGPPHQGYAPQWQHDQHTPQPHGQPPMQHNPQHPPHPQHATPLSASNYHPNYAPQNYQPTQYGPQQPPHNPPPFQNGQPQYNHNVPPPHQPPHQPPHNGPPQWNGPPQHSQPPFNNRGRGGGGGGGRGGFTNSRGGHEAPLMGPPIRMGFDSNRGNHGTQAGPGFSQSYPPQPPQSAPFSQPYTPGYSPHFPQAGQRPPLDSNSHGSPHRGRGGNVNNFRGKNRGESNNNQFRGRDNRQFSNGQKHDHFQRPAGADANGKKKKKRRTNTLGLTPNGVEHEDSDEEIDDADEEARLVTLLGPDTPQLPSDLEAWLQERRSRYPTKARRDAAAEELRQRREQNNSTKQKKDVVIKKEEGETKLERQQRKAEKLRLELQKAEQKIQDAMSGSKRKREAGDEGDDGLQSNSDSDSSSDSDDSKPETMSSRGKHQQQPKAQLQRHCKYFSTGGTCGKKGKCRFVHDQEVRNQALRDKEANGGKMTLAQRLILNDTAKDDLTILKSIRYLKDKGLMSEQLIANSSQDDDDDMAAPEENSYVDNLNYGDN